MVDGRGDDVGTYSFSTNFTVDESFGYALGDVVSDGVPSAGAGNIETQGSTDTYSFTGTAGQSVYFDALAGSATLADWSVTAPSSAVVFDSSGFFDRGPFVLPESGDVHVGGGRPRG